MFGLIPHRRAERKLAREFEPLSYFRPELPKLFERFFAPWTPFMEFPIEEWDTGLEVEDREKEILVKVAVPGFEPGEVLVDVSGNVLTIRAEHKEEKKEEIKEKKVKKEEAAETLYGRMLRSIMLPTGIEVEKVEALCKNGMLEVRLPKKPEATTRRIEVKT
jgi:HSP20 family protein